MPETTREPLDDATRRWCLRAQPVAECASGDAAECLALVREGILLRRQWDRAQPAAAARRRLLKLLATAQSVCHRWLTTEPDGNTAAPDRNTAEPDGAAAPDENTSAPLRVDRLLDEVAEDDRYLAGLLADETLPAETLAFAIECFRDDLHWLGTLAALVDGARGIDFTGRVVLEQEALERLLHSWEGDHSAPGGSATISDALRQSAEALRDAALARQVESLLGQPEPRDWQGWRQAWQAASRLAMRPSEDAAVVESLRAHRAEAIRRWSECLAALPADERSAALRQVIDELADAASEALTFLEDLPLAEAVGTLEVLAEDAATCQDALARHGGPSQRGLRRRLRRRRKAVAAELQERRLGWRMEQLFGRRAVAALEQLILLLLVLFVVVLVAEEPLVAYERAHWPGSSVVETTCAMLDLAICVVFLTEFSLKLFLARPRRLYFSRHWITGLLPAIPVGFIAYITHPDRVNLEVAGEMFVLLRALRYLRLPQMARWLRVARPVLRMGRLVGFAMQASDRLVRRIAPLLNRNLVLFERATIRIAQPPHRTRLAALRERFRYRAGEVEAGLSPPAVERLVRARIDDLTAMLSAPTADSVAPGVATDSSTGREIPVEEVIAWLLAATPADVSERVGRALAQSVARWCRAFDVLGARRLPIARDLVAAGRRTSPYGTTAEVANRIGALAKRMLDRAYWVADLYGTLTAPQLVDSIGDWLVKGTARPARRFLLFGAAFLLVFFVTGLMPSDTMRQLTKTLERVVAAPLMIVGVLCLIPLFIGLWFRQIAGEASNFCTRVAEAQFLTATKRLKRRFAKRHHAVLYRRVIAPECEIAGAGGGGGAGVAVADDRSALAPALSDEEREEHAGDDPVRSTVELLFDDYLDGAPFHHTDTKTTTQLLGNLALISLRQNRLRYGRRQQRRLRRLDLTNARGSLRGPYLWFHFISRSLAQQTAKLVVDYNARALPLARAATASDAEVNRYLQWLSVRWKTPIDALALAPQFRRRLGHGTRRTDDDTAESAETCAETCVAESSEPPSGKKSRRGGFQGTEFTAIHFLSADADLEADIRRRYGDLVADLMRRDRRDNIRRVFRTYPFHHQPRGQRRFNPLALYDAYLEGGRVLWLPLRIVWWSVRLVGHALRILWRFVGEVLNPSVGDLDPIEQPDPFAVAVRKIHRMRKPVFLRCLQMRAEFDPEYLGVALPGVALPGAAVAARHTTSTPIEEDLALIGADARVVGDYRAQAAECRRRLLDFRRLLPELNGEGLSAESLRAAAIAYAIDYRRSRRRLEAAGRLREFLDHECDQVPSAGWSIRQVWRRWRLAARVDRLLAQPGFRPFASRRAAFLRLLCHREGASLRRDLRTLTPRHAAADPEAESLDVLRSVARDPATWSRQLVVLRAVQTLSVLDLRTYCDLVAELGEYGPCPTDSPNGIVAGA